MSEEIIVEEEVIEEVKQVERKEPRVCTSCEG
jgi:hypothetical protein